MVLADKLRELREKEGASLQTVADAVGVSKPHIWELEKGKTKNPSLELLKKLALYYNVSLDDLAGMGGSNENCSGGVMLRRLDESQFSDHDKEMINKAIDFALQMIADNKKGSDEPSESNGSR